MGSFGRKIGRKQRAAGRPGSAAREDLPERLRELRRLVTDSTDLRQPLLFFNDRIANDESVFRMSERAEDEMIARILTASTRRAVETFEATTHLLFRIKQHRFWHGMVQGTGGAHAAFCYFEDVGVGVACIVGQATSRGEHYIRFTGVPIESPIIPGKVQRGQA